MIDGRSFEKRVASGVRSRNRTQEIVSLVLRDAANQPDSMSDPVAPEVVGLEVAGGASNDNSGDSVFEPVSAIGVTESMHGAALARDWDWLVEEIVSELNITAEGPFEVFPLKQ